MIATLQPTDSLAIVSGTVDARKGTDPRQGGDAFGSLLEESRARYQDATVRADAMSASLLPWEQQAWKVDAQSGDPQLPIEAIVENDGTVALAEDDSAAREDETIVSAAADLLALISSARVPILPPAPAQTSSAAGAAASSAALATDPTKARQPVALAAAEIFGEEDVSSLAYTSEEAASAIASLIDPKSIRHQSVNEHGARDPANLIASETLPPELFRTDKASPPLDALAQPADVASIRSASAPDTSIALYRGEAASSPARLDLPSPLASTVGTTEWHAELGTKVVWMVGEKQQSATLTLNPPDLGPVVVQIDVDGAIVQASFLANDPNVRNALDAALPALKELLEQAGLQLGGANVGADARRSRDDLFGTTHDRRGAPQAGARGSSSTNGELNVKVAIASSARGSGLIDTFA